MNTQSAQPYQELSVQLAAAEAAVAALRARQRRSDHVEKVLLALRRINRLVTEAKDVNRLVDGACAALTEGMGYQTAWIALIDSGSAAIVSTASSGFNGAFGVLERQLEVGNYPDCVQHSLDSGALKVVEDPHIECVQCPLASQYEGCAAFSQPLSYEGRTYGLLSVATPKQFAADAEEQALFSEVVADLSFALDTLYARERFEGVNERLQLSVDSAGLGIWEWDLVSNKTACNKKWASMLGYEREAIGATDYTTWRQKVHPEDLPRVEATLQRAIQEGESGYKTEYRMRHKDGGWVWIEDRGRAMHPDAEGKPQKMFGVHINIDAFKQMEAALERSRQFLHRVLEISPGYICVKNLEGRFLMVNKKLADFYGLSVEAMTGELHARFCEDPEELAAMLAADQAVFESGQPLFIPEESMLSPAGESRVLATHKIPFTAFDESAVLIASTDITEIKQAEEKLKRQLHYEHGIAAIATTLIQEEENEATLSKALALLRETVSADRVYMFKNFEHPDKGLCMRQCYEACAPDVMPEMNNPLLQCVPYVEGFGRWHGALSAGKPIQGHVAEFPAIERTILEAQNIQSLLVLPLFVNEAWMGFIGFDATQGPRLWRQEEVVLLQTAADIFSGYFERLRYKRAFEQSEVKQRSLLETTLDWTWQTDVDGRYRACKQNVITILGYQPEEMLGKTPYALMSPEEAQRVHEALDAIIAKRARVVRFEHAMIAKDGREVIFESNATPSFDSSGEWEGYFGAGRDITARKRAERALRVSETRVRKKLDAILTPDESLEVLELADILDTEKIQRIMENFFKVTGIGMAIVDCKGSVLVACGWQDICTRFHRIHPESRKHCMESDLGFADGLALGEFRVYTCKNMLRDVVTPIIIGDKHVGNVYTGQFLYADEAVDYAAFRQQAQRYGFEEEAYLDALDRIPRWSGEMVRDVMQFLSLFAAYLSNLSYAPPQAGAQPRSP